MNHTMKREVSGGMKGVATIVGLLATLMLAGQALAAKQPPPAPVDINKAGVEELMSLPGVGPAKAQAIMAYRQVTPFASTDDLANVKGIGQKMLAKIAPFVKVNGGSGAKAPGTAEKAAH
ncbi:MAG TPA: helix-hairpin-helix domain-containing protein [bacterium]|nr:helix-hairpin-helix domain-containing protein [bacterium]